MNPKKDLNLGCVVYRATKEGLEATWMRSGEAGFQNGIGKAIRLTDQDPDRIFEGEYKIIYYDQQQNPSPQLHLSIAWENGGYQLTWRNDETITDRGIGFMDKDCLVVSFKAL